MPEGPEIRIEADRIAAVLEGERIEAALFGLPRLEPLAESLVGCRVDAVETRGKALLTYFDDGRVLYTHNQLYGRWYVRPRGKLPDTNRSLRVALHTATGSALLYSASEIELMEAGELAMHPFLSKLGPDALCADLTWQALARRLKEPRFRNRLLTSLYLDQQFLAGIGNYLRSEILFFARISPALRPAELDANAVNRLARQSLAVTRRSYEKRGVTNPAKRVAELRRAGRKRGGYRFAVFARDGRPCYDCGTKIERMDANSRRLYWCPSCQAPGVG